MIEQNRKAPLTLVVERNGRPVSGAQVDLKLARHEYPFATFLDTDPTLNTQDAAKYRELVPKLFNQVTVPIYWADWGWESAESRAGYFNRFRWARSQGLPMKAHNLVWPSFKWSPSRLQQLRDNPTALRNAILGEAEERAKALADQPFVNVDVLNELKSEYEFAEIVGKGIYKELFDLSRRTWPKAELVYNDYDVFEGGGLNEGPREVTKRLIRELIADKAPLTKIGWQGHFGESATPPEVVWKLLDEFWNEFKLPIEITEFDVDTRDERSQADYTRDLLTAWFAHPRTAGFTMWGFHETYHWRPNGAMFRRDWTPKPNLAEWTNLTQKVWTTQSKGVTNRSGQVRIRGFRGTYTVKVTSGGKTSTHSAKLTGNGSLIVVKLP
jgi:endo-1,4-beta-xylanase